MCPNVTQFLPGKFTFYCSDLKSVAGVTLVGKAAGDRRTMFRFEIIGSKGNKMACSNK
jgi:hypothetical protein